MIDACLKIIDEASFRFISAASRHISVLIGLLRDFFKIARDIVLIDSHNKNKIPFYKYIF